MPRGRHKRGHGMPKGFVSKKQMRLFAVNPKLRKYLHKEAHKAGMRSSITKRLGFSPAYRRLPLRKGSAPHGRVTRGGAR